MMYEKIDIETWSRKASYTFFTENPSTIYMSANIDITEFADYVKAQDLSLYICILYVITLCINEIDGFKMAYAKEAGETYPVIYDKVNPNYPVMDQDGNIINKLAEFTTDFNIFYENITYGIREAREQKNNSFHTADGFFLTSYVAYPFTSTFMISEKDIKPCVIWGKYIKEGNLKKLPVTISYNHAFIDGQQFVDFFTRLERCFTNPLNILQMHAEHLL